MRAIEIKKIVEIVGGKLNVETDGFATSVFIDSRDVMQNSMFAAFVGEKVDGHDYIGKAFENGASCCMGSFVPEGEKRPVIVVEDVQEALQTLAEYYRSTLSIPIIGITGSVGKTTTKEMISAVLGSRYNVLKTEKNLNNELGVPLTIFRIEEEHEIAVIEMGISHFTEMTRLAKMAKPDMGVFTVIGHAHLENLGSREGILWAKTEMIQYLQPNGLMIVNGDDDLLYKYPAEREKVTYGTQSRCKIRATDIKMTASSTSCTISDGERSIHIDIPAYGNHMIYAALASVTVGFYYKMTDSEIIDGIKSYHTVGRRSDVVDTGKLSLIDDCYNANPDSVKSAIESMEHFNRRRVAVLGDMFELGKEQEILHYNVGKYAAEHGVDLVLATGVLSENTVRGAEDAGGRAIHFPSKELLMEKLPEYLMTGDVVLVKASHSMEYDQVSEFIKNLK